MLRLHEMLQAAVKNLAVCPLNPDRKNHQAIRGRQCKQNDTVGFSIAPVKLGIEAKRNGTSNLLRRLNFTELFNNLSELLIPGYFIAQPLAWGE